MIEIPDLDESHYEEQRFRNFKFSNQQDYQFSDSDGNNISQIDSNDKFDEKYNKSFEKYDKYSDKDAEKYDSYIETFNPMNAYKPRLESDSTSFISDIIEVNTAVTSHVKKDSVDNSDRLQKVHLDQDGSTDSIVRETPLNVLHKGPQEKHMAKLQEAPHITEKVIDSLPQVDDNIDSFEQGDSFHNERTRTSTVLDHTDFHRDSVPSLWPSNVPSHTVQLGEFRKGLATDFKSPVEYTLHIVFTQFVRHAERKLNVCLNLPEPEIIETLAEGSDSQFDHCISSLGYIARQKPKPIIDSAMIWRRSKSEVALMAAAEVDRVYQSAKTNLARVPSKSKRSLLRSKSLRDRSVSSEDTDYARQKQFYDEEMSHIRDTAIHAERKSLAAIYILCRVLIEVVKHTSPEVMGDDLGGKLEEIVYTQLKTTDPITTAGSLLRSANWNLFAELLGHLSCKRFLTVSDRFIADLEKIPAHVHHDDEPRLHLLIHGMRYLKLTNYPLETFEESAEFIESLAKFFSSADNELIILAYSEVLASLLLPLANILTAETNHPTWTSAITTIYTKAKQIWRRSDSADTKAVGMSPNGPANSGSNVWECSVNLLTAALTVSHKELFQHWFEIIEDNQSKLRPKVDIEEKVTLITCTARLVWVYIFRLNDTLNNTIKNLDNLFQLLFFGTNKKQQWITDDKYLLNALIELLRIVGYKHLNYVLDSVLIRLLKTSFTGSLETLNCEKVMLVSRGYLRILQDYEIGQRPQFPAETLHETGSNKPEPEFTFVARTSDNHLSHEEICKHFGVLLKLLDGQYGCDIWPKDASTPLSATFKPQPFFHFGDYSYQSTKNLHLELFSNLIDTIPYTMVNEGPLSGISYKGIVELLTRNSVHTNYKVASSCVNALKKLSARKNPSNLMISFAKFAFHFSEKPNPDYNTNYLNSTEFQKLLKLYVELLTVWLRQFKQANSAKNTFVHPLSQEDEVMSKDVLNDLYQINYKTDDLGPPKEQKTSKDELEWKNIITSIEEIEGNGLFFLCNQDYKIRHFGISILRLIQQFDEEIYNVDKGDDSSKDQAKTSSDTDKIDDIGHSRTSSKFAADTGTRLIDILENQDFLDLINPFKAELSVPERNRINKLKYRKSILIRLAESDYGMDTTLWFRIYPKILDIFFDKCPMPVAICRSIVCVRLVQMHEQILEYSDSYNKNYTSSLFLRPSHVAPEVLVDQWRLYLIFVCCSLTSTNEQKISFPSQPTHGRKRSMQMFIQHQKITSAKSIFRMVLPLLKSQQPMVKDSIISGLSCININIFKTLLENVQSLNDWDETLKKRDINEDRSRIELVHILSKITTRFSKHRIIYSDDWIIANLVSIIKTIKSFLSTPKVQVDITFQKLRRYFCKFLENVFIGLKNYNSLDRWLPFEARIGCFNYLKEWCEFDSLSEQRYQTMLTKSGSKDLTSSAAILEVERKVLQYASLSCMATICSGNIIEEIEVDSNFAVMSFDIPLLMNWVNSLLRSPTDNIVELGKNALSNILKLNPTNTQIYQEVLTQCYKAQDNPRTTEAYYVIFVKFLTENPNIITDPVDLYCLSTFLIGDDNFLIRQHSMKLLKFLESKFNKSNSIDVFSRSVDSKNKAVYKKALFEVSVHLASSYPQEAANRISYLTMCFNQVNNNMRSNILSCLLPWVQTVDLKTVSSEQEPESDKTTELSPATIMVLNNLFEITVKFSSKISNEVEALWVALGAKPTNFDLIFQYLISNSLERKNATFVEYASQIIDYLSFSQPEVSGIVDKLISNLEPKSMIPPRPKSVITTVGSDEFPYVANLWDLIPCNEKDASFSLGQLSLIFLVDLFTSQSDRMINHLPLLLHVCFACLDHYLPIVQEAVVSLLCHLLHSLASLDPKTEIVISKLANKDRTKFLWVYDDLNNDKRGARTPKNMDLLVRNVLEILTPISATLQEDWSKVSLNWATTCAVRHLACRSFQIFRSLLSVLDQPMLKDMLHRLSNTISDETPDIQGFAMQILMTLNAINAELDSEKLIDFPQLFWSGVACLSTVHEQEFIEVLSAMSKFVSKIDLDSPETVSCLISTFPPKWEGRFEGLQHVVMNGLRSGTSYDQTIRFLDKLGGLHDSEIIANSRDSRLLMTIISNLPRFLHAFDSKNIPKEIEDVAMMLSSMSERHGKQSLAKIFVSISKNRFRSKKDFLVQTITSIKNIFFPEFEAQTLVLLLGFLSNKVSWIKLETLTILKYLVPFIDLQREEFIGVGADLISPLLRLLLTDYAEQALEVLDECVSISGSQLDKDVLRMSLGNSSMKKEYERTATLFGIPDESGWSIPMPAVTASSTRNNVHAVFSTCASTTTKVEEEGEEFHFHREDYAPPNVNDNATIEEHEAASLSHMWAALDDFDSFFTKENDVPIPSRLGANNRIASSHLMSPRANNNHTHSASGGSITGTDTLTPLDSAPFVYDKKASVILNRSLARTQSNSSFKTNLADSIGNSYVSNANFASNTNTPGSKRSYIPFRNSRYHQQIQSRDNFTTPSMTNSPTFEVQTPIEGEDSSMFDSILGNGKKKGRRQNKSNPSLAERPKVSPGSPNVKAKKRTSQKFK